MPGISAEQMRKVLITSVQDWVGESETSCGNRDPKQSSWQRQDLRNQTGALTTPNRTSWILKASGRVYRPPGLAWREAGCGPSESSRLVLGARHWTALWIFSGILQSQCYNSYFTVEEVEVKLNQRPRSQSQWVAEWASALVGLIQSTFSFCEMSMPAREDCSVSILASLSCTSGNFWHRRVTVSWLWCCVLTHKTKHQREDYILGLWVLPTTLGV